MTLFIRTWTQLLEQVSIVLACFLGVQDEGNGELMVA